MSKFKSCFVDGCFHNEENSSHLFHRFPTAGKRNSQRVNTWAEFSKPEAPLDSSEIQKLYMRQVFICGAHFPADSYQEVNPSKLHIHSIPKIPPSSIPSSSYPNGSPSLYPPQPSPQCPPTPPSDSSSDQFPSTSSDGPLPMDIDPVIPSAPPELPLTCPVKICSSDATPTSAPEIPQPQLDPQNTPVTPKSSNTERSARLTASNKTPVSTRSLLKDLKVTRFNKLTPRKQRLLLSNRRKERSLKRMKDQIKNLKVRTSKTVIDLPAFKNFPPALKLLIESTLRIGNCKPKGRRWTLEDKIQALTLHKNSPKNYALLRTFFPLPSARTLRSVLSKVPFSPGICQPVLDALKKSVAAMNPLDRYCTLMFDEISLRQQLWYNRGQDRIEGFQDHKGQGVSSKLADHGLVFMIQGLRRHYKQPVAYYLSHSATTAERLVIFIKNVIRACRDAGLHIASTVCDLGTSNVSALKKLGATPEEPYFYLDEEEKGKIHTILDPCHLLKCTRNNLMTKDVTFTVDMNGKKETGTAKWSHIQKVAEEDKKLVFRKLAHIDDDDLNPDRCKKMKVAAAAHVLSHTVASAVEYEYRNGVLKDDPSAIFTAYFTKSVDDMFDSVNGRGMIPYKGKVLRTRIDEKSPHIAFYEKSMRFVRTWKYTGKEAPPPHIPGWITTFKAIKYLWLDLKKVGFFYLDPKRLNQDPIENLFGLIRANCGGNSRPTCPQFAAALKTIIINNFAFLDIKGMNCEADEAKLLTNLRSFLEAEAEPIENVSEVLDSLVPIGGKTEKEMEAAVLKGGGEADTVAYIAGSVARSILSKVKCSDCEPLLKTDYNVGPVSASHSWISQKEYNKSKRSLVYPTQKLSTCVGSCLHFVEDFLNKRPYVRNIRETIITTMTKQYDFSWLEGCPNEDHVEATLKMICDGVFFINVKWWCQRFNKNLSATQFAKKKKVEKKIKTLKHM